MAIYPTTDRTWNDDQTFILRVCREHLISRRDYDRVMAMLVASEASRAGDDAAMARYHSHIERLSHRGLRIYHYAISC